MINRTAELRRLLAEERFIDMPVAYDPLGGRLVESLGFKTVYNGGFVTGGSRCTSEPLLTMRTAGDIAKAVEVPVVADAGAGFGEPLHAMRTVRVQSGNSSMLGSPAFISRISSTPRGRTTTNTWPT